MKEPDHLQTARNKSTNDLIRDAAGYKPDSYPGLAHRYEIERRKHAGADLRSWIALLASIVSTLISLLK